MLEERAGVDYIGKYRSNARQRAALRTLGQDVTEIAVDRGLFTMIAKAFPGKLDARRDNRSVTSSEWAQEGLGRYGCPVHSTAPTSRRDIVEAKRGGLCSCRLGGKDRTKLQSRKGKNQGVRDRTLHGPGTGVDGDSRQHGRTTSRDVALRDDSGIHRDPWSQVGYIDALAASYSIASNEGRRREPLSIREVVDHHIHRGNYAGAPYFSRNRDALPLAEQHAVEIRDGTRAFSPYVAGRRIQPGTPGPKTRLVWMASLSTTILGTSFSKAVSRGLAKKRPFVWGYRNVDKGAIISELTSRFRYAYCLDISGFDASIPATMIDDAFGVCRTYLDLNEKEADLWKRYINDFIHSRLMLHDGSVYQVHKGVPSGSAFTSIIDSIVNLILMQYVWIKLTGRALKRDQLVILGDDVVVADDVRLPKQALESAASDLGFKLSASKTSIVDTHAKSEGPYHNRVFFLGHYWVNGVPRRPIHELLQRMAFPERHARRTYEDSCLRAVSYLADCVESWEVLQAIKPSTNVMEAVYYFLNEAGGDTQEVVVPVRDLPGRLAYQVAVEGSTLLEEQGALKGLKVAVTGMYF